MFQLVPVLLTCIESSFTQRDKQKTSFDRPNCLVYRLKSSLGVMFFINCPKLLEQPVLKTAFHGFLCQQLISNFETQFLIFPQQLEAEMKNRVAIKDRVAQKCSYLFLVDKKMCCSLVIILHIIMIMLHYFQLELLRQRTRFMFRIFLKLHFFPCMGTL